MNLMDKIKALFAEETFASVDVKTADGRIMRAAELAVGADISEVAEEGEVAVADGDYELESGETVVVADGKISEIKEAEAIEETEVVNEEMAKTAKKKRYSGKRKFSEDEAGETVEAEGELTVVVENFEVGAEAVVIDEDFKVIEDFTGDIEVEVDGEMKDVHFEDGKVDEVKEVAGETEDVAEEVVSEEYSMQTFSIEFAQVMKDEIEKMKQVFEKQNSELKNEIENLKNQPAEKETSKTMKFEKEEVDVPLSPIQAFVKSKRK